MLLGRLQVRRGNLTTSHTSGLTASTDRAMGPRATAIPVRHYRPVSPTTGSSPAGVARGRNNLMERSQVYRHLSHRPEEENQVPWKSGKVAFTDLDQRYYWPGLFRDVARYVKQCEKCQKFKVSQPKPAGRMLTCQVEELLRYALRGLRWPTPTFQTWEYDASGIFRRVHKSKDENPDFREHSLYDEVTQGNGREPEAPEDKARRLQHQTAENTQRATIDQARHYNLRRREWRSEHSPSRLSTTCHLTPPMVSGGQWHITSPDSQPGRLKAYHTELEPDAQPETGPGLSAPETTPSLSNFFEALLSEY
ncbi:hypothetical protein ACLKA6_006017 [Drosophila palustris]